MGDGAKKQPPGVSVVADLRTMAAVLSPRRAKAFALGFALATAACTVFLALAPPGGNASPWLAGLFNSSAASAAPYKAQLSSLLYHFFPNSSASPVTGFPGSPESGQVSVGNPVGGPQGNAASEKDRTENGPISVGRGLPVRNQTTPVLPPLKNGVTNGTFNGVGSPGSGSLKNQTTKEVRSYGSGPPGKAVTENGKKDTAADPLAKGEHAGKNQTKNGAEAGFHESRDQAKNQTALRQAKASNFTASLMKRNGSASPAASDAKNSGKDNEDWVKSLVGCDMFHGRWVRDDSYPLYPEGSCPHIDEPFDCYLNGRPDRAYQKLRWQPYGCSIPRLNATDMLERLRGKRLVFVGDSLNRNMWESLVCVLRNSVKDKRTVFEMSGRREFRTEGSYSFLFKDYNCTVEFFRSPFLVQEWEMPSTNGTKKETLRLDIIEHSSPKYKDAHVIIFNTGHWWTHEKTSKGKDYYQEGNRVYGELNVVDAFHKALNTWAKWVDHNVNPKKTLVFFRGYSASHFSGGQWNSGGACDKETEPIKNETYLSAYPPKMRVLETVIKGMKVPVSYLNITRMTDYRKDAHPSIYRKQNLTDEERRAPERFQDCSHWCLPGVPDSWNELLYAQLIVKQHQLWQVGA